MTSVTLPRRAHNLHSISENQNNQFFQTDDEETKERIDNNDQHSNKSSTKKSPRASSYNESETQSPTASNNRLRHLCSRVKRRLTLTKEDRTRSEDISENASERRIRFRNYKSFSSTVDDPVIDFEWPDFEKVYDSIPACLINALPGLDDFSIDGSNDDVFSSLNFENDESDEYPTQRMNLFVNCKRGKYFRRNAVCQKLDKSQYNGQLDIFIQQLMIEKLMRTWT